MPDPSATDVAPASPKDELAAQLTSSLSSIWRNHSGGKPSSATTELSTNSVKFVLEDAVSGIGAVDPDPDADADPDPGAGADATPRSPNTHGYKNDAIAAVRRITGRRVVGFVPKRNKKTDVATDTYLLEPPHVAR